uniref:Uncharacterized protein n=1 Tax=Anguilla anguilla TaxID=7936 RepID=A0A0E9RDW4_ANGAN
MTIMIPFYYCTIGLCVIQEITLLMCLYFSWHYINKESSFTDDASSTDVLL